MSVSVCVTYDHIDDAADPELASVRCSGMEGIEVTDNDGCTHRLSIETVAKPGQVLTTRG